MTTERMPAPNTGLASLIFNWQKWRSETSEQCPADTFAVNQSFLYPMKSRK
jgi:hypothetical protein